MNLSMMIKLGEDIEQITSMFDTPLDSADLDNCTSTNKLSKLIDEAKEHNIDAYIAILRMINPIYLHYKKDIDNCLSLDVVDIKDTVESELLKYENLTSEEQMIFMICFFLQFTQLKGE